MATIEVDISGVAYANHLATTLSDLEFEMLLRERIKAKFAAIFVRNENLGESYNSCSFTYSWDDKSTWSVSLGKNYATRVSASGQVLNATVEDAMAAHDRQHANKLSLLLGGPAEDVPF